MGRFINADGFTSTGQGILGNNMFAYCANTPVQYVDPEGQRIEAREDISSYGGVIFYVGFSATYTYLTEKWEDFENKLKNSISKMKSLYTYKSPTEIHHIAAQKAFRAEEARDILFVVFADGTENTNNKIELKTALHRRIHNYFYYAVTNTLVVEAYDAANGDLELARQNVTDVLNGIAAYLTTLNALIPE